MLLFWHHASSRHLPFPEVRPRRHTHAVLGLVGLSMPVVLSPWLLHALFTFIFDGSEIVVGLWDAKIRLEVEFGT